jgi:hypothetical protein
MRSFVEVGAGEKKDAIMSQVYERFGFNSKAPRKGERSNIADAFLHAYIGSCVYYAREGAITSQLKPSEKRVVYGDSKKMIGLLERTVITREGYTRGKEEKGS